MKPPPAGEPANDSKDAVEKASRKSLVKRFFGLLGPGLVAGEADDDPSGIIAYSVLGAKLCTPMLWAAVVTWPLMAFTAGLWNVGRAAKNS